MLVLYILSKISLKWWVNYQAISSSVRLIYSQGG